MTRAIAAILAALVTVAACDTAGRMWDGSHAGRGLVIHYTTQQPTCSRAQLGEHATVVGDGRPFHVVCLPNGPIFTWDAR